MNPSSPLLGFRLSMPSKPRFILPASSIQYVARAEPTSIGEVGSVLLDAVAQQQSVDPLRLDHLGGEVTEVAVDRPLDSFLAVPSS